MNAIPPSITPGAPAQAGAARSSAIGKWAALQNAANVVASLAGIEPRPANGDVSDFPSAIRKASPWRRTLAEHSIHDLAAVIEPGLAALLGIDARGSDPRPAALALWREIEAARAAILALLATPDA
jgi:hypothetical protein